MALREGRRKKKRLRKFFDWTTPDETTENKKVKCVACQVPWCVCVSVWYVWVTADGMAEEGS